MPTPVKPNGHEEIRVKRGLILLSAHDTGMLGKAEFDVIGVAKDITFNDIFVSYNDETGVKHYRELNGWKITVYAYACDKEPEPVPEPKQITIFDILEGI